jgi:hypothetical protein
MHHAHSAGSLSAEGATAAQINWPPRPSHGNRVLGEHLPLLVLVGAYCAAGYVAQWLFGLPDKMGNVWFETTFLVYPLLAVVSLPFAFAAHRWSVRDEQGRWIAGIDGWRLAALGRRTRFVTAERLASVAVAVLIIPLFLNTYGSWKGMIPDLHPFAFDPALTSLDRSLHMGHDPWQQLQPVIGHPMITRMIDVLYILWLPLNAGMIVWQGWSPRRELRKRFFLSYVLIYMLLGTAAAIALSAAGPCYYAAVTGGPSPYQPLMDYLGALDATQPLFAIRVQHTLWQNYASGSNMPFVGISAMPSVHVGVAVLFALMGWRTARWLGGLLTAYAAVVMVGSVHLGWHYAVDGYASVAGTLAIWWAVDATLRRRDQTRRQ